MPAGRRAGLDLRGESPHEGVCPENTEVDRPVNAQSDLQSRVVRFWQLSGNGLSGSPADALCLVKPRGFEPLAPCMPLTSQPLTPQWASPRCPSTALVSWRMASKRHGAGCGDMRFGCWQIAGGSAMRALRSRWTGSPSRRGASDGGVSRSHGSLRGGRRPSSLPRPSRRRVDPAVRVPAGGRLGPPRPACGPAGRLAAGGPARRSGRPTG
jgi:hypothetical protein